MALIEVQDRERERDERHGSEEKENGEGRDSPSESAAANNDDETVNGRIPSFNDDLLCKHRKSIGVIVLISIIKKKQFQLYDNIINLKYQMEYYRIIDYSLLFTGNKRF